MGWFANRIVAWQRRHGRHDLPWQRADDPYRIWVSEIMLQQTQVGTVIPYYLRFVERFPDVRALAAAPQDELMRVWSGLGYYGRARNLHACAQRIAGPLGGQFPRSAAELARLPGIGRSTAAAIAAFAFGERAAILDGNVGRVLCRAFGVEGFPGAAATQRRLWEIAGRELPVRDVKAYTQGLMDLGATLCTRARPDCGRCPVASRCVARASGRVAQLPAPRPRRALPTRSTTMLVIRRGDEVLVEKRPPAGIWGGLWSLPQLAIADGGDDASPREDAPRASLARYGLVERSRRELPAFEHAFTHFRLRVRALLLDTRRSGARAAAEPEAAGRLWLPLAEVDGAALPRPVKTLLQRLRGEPASHASEGPARSPDTGVSRTRARSARSRPARRSAR